MQLWLPLKHLLKKNLKNEYCFYRPIKKELFVEASQETCFNAFTKKMDAWWPWTHHVGSTPLLESVLELKPDGRWYTKHEDGSTCTVGHVLTWKPYELLIHNWQTMATINTTRNLEPKWKCGLLPKGQRRPALNSNTTT